MPGGNGSRRGVRWSGRHWSGNFKNYERRRQLIARTCKPLHDHIQPGVVVVVVAMIIIVMTVFGYLYTLTKKICTHAHAVRELTAQFLGNFVSLCTHSTSFISTPYTSRWYCGYLENLLTRVGMCSEMSAIFVFQRLFQYVWSPFPHSILQSYSPSLQVGGCPCECRAFVFLGTFASILLSIDLPITILIQRCRIDELKLHRDALVPATSVNPQLLRYVHNYFNARADRNEFNWVSDGWTFWHWHWQWLWKYPNWCSCCLGVDIFWGFGV